MPHDLSNQPTLNAYRLFEVIISKHQNLYQISSIDKLTDSINHEASPEKIPLHQMLCARACKTVLPTSTF